MIQSDVMAQLAAKKAEAQKRLAELKAQEEAARAELASLDSGIETAQEALAAFESLLSATEDEFKPALFPMLFKALEQEAKRSGIQLQQAVSTDAIINAQATKAKTRKTKDELTEPSEFAVFQQNKRLGLDGKINGNAVKYTKVYIGVDALRNTPASDSTAPAWRDWLKSADITDEIKTGDFFLSATTAGLQGNYILELSNVLLRDLAKLVDLDFSSSPTSEENEQRMSGDYAQLKMMEEDEVSTEDATESEPTEQAEQTEEIRETEPVKVTPTESLYPIGTKFQVTGVTGFEGSYGEIVKVNPDLSQPYECEVAGFTYHPMLKHDQIQPIDEEVFQVEAFEQEALEEDTELADIVF